MNQRGEWLAMYIQLYPTCLGSLSHLGLRKSTDR